MGDNEKKDVEINETSQSNPVQSQAEPEPKKKSKKWLIAVLVVLGILVASFLLFGSCTAETSVSTSTSSSSDNSAESVKTSASDTSANSSAPTWAVYMYICGSNLEQKNKNATNNILQLKSSDMPDNMTIVMELGGSPKWWIDAVSPDELSIWTMTKQEGALKREALPQANMGEKDTFLSFAKYCSENYPADNTMLIIWDHGNGPQGGACKDYNFDNGKMLQINEIAEALQESFGAQNTQTPLDIINFDCCLMASEEIAYQLRDCASILVASEELIPGTGQDYEGFISAIAANPSITPVEYAKTIIDNYEKQYSPNGEETVNTLSAVDLSKIETVNDKMDAFAGSLIKGLYADPHSIVDIGLQSIDVNAFAVNNKVVSYTNLVDIKDFADEVGDDGKEAKELMQAVDDAVIHQHVGSYHEGCSGLSMYYALCPVDWQYEAMLKQGTSVGFKAYHQLTQGRELSDDSKEFIKSLGEDPDALPKLSLFKNIENKDSYPIEKNSNGDFYVDFGPEIGSCSTNVFSRLAMSTEKGLCLLGIDDEIDDNWKTGVFTSNFGKRWFKIGDWFTTAFLAYDSEDYNVFMIPFAFADEDSIYYLLIVFDNEKQTWTELGYIGSTSQPEACKTNPIEEGTEIRVVQYIFNGQNNPEPTAVGSVKYTKDFIHYQDLPDGDYKMTIFVEDALKDSIESEVVNFKLENGKMISE